MHNNVKYEEIGWTHEKYEDIIEFSRGEKKESATAKFYKLKYILLTLLGKITIQIGAKAYTQFNQQQPFSAVWNISRRQCYCDIF